MPRAVLETSVASVIHDIINSIDQHPDYGANYDHCVDARQRRARRLASEATRILRLIRKDISREEWERYEAIYAHVESGLRVDTTAYLSAAESLWDFAVRTCQAIDWRCTEPHRPARPQARVPGMVACPPAAATPAVAPAIAAIPMWMPQMVCSPQPAYLALPTYAWSPTILTARIEPAN